MPIISQSQNLPPYEPPRNAAVNNLPNYEPPRDSAVENRETLLSRMKSSGYGAPPSSFNAGIEGRLISSGYEPPRPVNVAVENIKSTTIEPPTSMVYENPSFGVDKQSENGYEGQSAAVESGNSTILPQETTPEVMRISSTPREAFETSEPFETGPYGAFPSPKPE